MTDITVSTPAPITETSAAPVVESSAPAATPVDAPIPNIIGDSNTEATTATENPTDATSKPEGDKAATEAAPYGDFTLPDGASVDEITMGEFKDLAKEAGLPQEQAQKMVDLYSREVQKAQDASWNLWKDTNAAWQGQVASDAEIGGAKQQEIETTILKGIQGVMNAAETAAVKDMFKVTGSGNHPEMIRLLHRLTEGRTEGKYTAGRPSSTPVSPAAKLYPNQQTQS